MLVLCSRRVVTKVDKLAAKVLFLLLCSWRGEACCGGVDNRGCRFLGLVFSWCRCSGVCVRVVRRARGPDSVLLPRGVLLIRWLVVAPRVVSGITRQDGAWLQLAGCCLRNGFVRRVLVVVAACYSRCLHVLSGCHVSFGVRTRHLWLPYVLLNSWMPRYYSLMTAADVIITVLLLTHRT